MSARSPRPARLGRGLGLFLYYAVASRLPASEFPFGGVWRRIRAACCRRFLAGAGEDINVEPRVYLASGRHVRLGSRSGFGRGSRIYAAEVGRDVMIAPEVVMLARNHAWEDLERPIAEQGEGPLAVPVIEDGAWIGERAVILPGRRIGRGAIIGAGAVVSRDVEPFAIVAGNPARPVGHRRPSSSE